MPIPDTETDRQEKSSMFGVVVVVVRTVPVQEEFWNRNLIGMKALLCMCGINSPARRYSARLSVSASAGEREEGEREGERGGREREREAVGKCCMERRSR